MRKDQQRRLDLLKEGFTPQEAGRLDFHRWLHRIKPKRSLSRRQASQSGKEMWSQLPKAEKKKRSKKPKTRRTWIQPGPGSGMI